MLGADDVLDPPPRRVLVAGTAGVGKTTTAQRIARAIGAPHTELDGMYHGPGWTALPDFEARVDEVTSAPTWVSEWQYRQVRQLLVERADTLVWLDLPKPVAFVRLLRRTIRRRLHRTVLWNGNVEPPLWTFFTRSEHILRWGIAKRNEMRQRVPVLAADTPHLRVVHLRSQREIERFVGRLRTRTE
ncbi:MULTISPECIES: AAA family ATPase [unclassified Curtobacterium]|uniref:AAA family ATPase n=1 Tax=unclassified Curtobacterium TaxID=257496 RepID=UPI000DA70FA9|nr:MULTISPECIES: AAA family ATPase [unclassified Curtobacterium]MDY1003466.1 AAA family ATPase [Curtobacterium sp. CFBP9011]WIE62512.1 AAA family ATPase [Curtobacterium sp. MCLR17_032]